MKTDNQNKSRRRTPWDNFERTEMQNFIRTAHMQLYAQKHSKLADSNEDELITVENAGDAVQVTLSAMAIPATALLNTTARSAEKTSQLQQEQYFSIIRSH